MKTVPYVVSAASKVDEQAISWTHDKDQNPPGWLPQHDINDNLVANSFYAGYTAYLTKQLRAGVPTVQQIQDTIVNDSAATDPKIPNTAQFVKGNGGNNNAKINAGASSLGMEFVGNNDDLDNLLPDQPYLALNPLLTNTTYYRWNRDSGKQGKVNYTGDGSYDSLIAGLKNLQTAIDANKGKISTNIVLGGHGYATEKNVTPKPAAVPDAPMQGEMILPQPMGQPFSLDVGMDPGFWSDLHEGVTQNTPGLFRADQPDFFLSVSAGTLTQPVGISIDGISLGSFSLSIPSIGGAMLDVPLSDSFLSQLFADNPTMPSDIPVSFTMAPGDSMQLALAGDILNDPTFNQTEYGTGIGIDVEQVPEPASAAIVGGGILLLLTRRVRKPEVNPLPS